LEISHLPSQIVSLFLSSSSTTEKITGASMGFTIQPTSATALTSNTTSTNCVKDAGVSMLVVHGPQRLDPTTLDEKVSVLTSSSPSGSQLQYALGGFRRPVLRPKDSSSSSASSPSSSKFLNSRRSKSSKNQTTNCLDIIETALVELNKNKKQDKQQQRPSLLLSPEQKKARRVRFAPTSEHQFIPSTLFHGLSKEDIQNGWWTSRDTERTCQEQRELVRAFQTSEPRAMSDYFHLLKLCLCESKEEDLLPKSPHHNDVFLVLPMATTSMRGLEVDLAPTLKKIRRTYRREVLNCASKIPPNLNRDLRDRMLAARSATLSLPIRRLARVTGEADAIEC
jgi:hypothetical protein